MRAICLTLTAVLAACPAAGADVLAPGAAAHIALGSIEGVTYYLAEPTGLHVVATLTDGESGQPIRVEVTLAAGQRLEISVPRGPDRAAEIVELLRAGDQLIVRQDERTTSPCRRPEP